MTRTPLARLNEADWPSEGVEELQAKFTPALVQEVCDRFGLTGNDRDISFELTKVLIRYQSAARKALKPDPSPQSKELERLKKAIARTLTIFETLSEENKSAIDGEIMYRDPFNSKFFFKEQLDFWRKNEYSTKTAMLKLTQISHAITLLKNAREAEAYIPRKTVNRPLDHLIQDLTLSFERGTDRKAKKCNYYDDPCGNYVGQFFEFIVFILDLFAPSSYHSHVALGKRIERVLGKMAM
ncbi:hypothetical protein shim_34140 [Shimia sp. SK013]|uniref:hypothetical protein n=1 Tax=Shimia sp. SK013 TaxID=1389006 RepID=UPI0006B5EA22|nr:hypothetical protein [Shimia sp. SK013]KPA20424.1 hypothetical protein shim_34140 [Shimia sp. SK013]